MAISTTTSGGTITSFSNTPQAMGDLLTTTATGSLLTEDSGIVYLDVMANDLGGASKTLWSLDDGSSLSTATKIIAPLDLLTQDAKTEALSTDFSEKGAKSGSRLMGKLVTIQLLFSQNFKALLLTSHLQIVLLMQFALVTEL